MSFSQRETILKALECVWWVHSVDDFDDTVLKGIEKLFDDYCDHNILFAKGGDRTTTNTPELELCAKLGIKTVFGVGGGKTQSSSDLLKRWKEKLWYQQTFITKQESSYPI